jgi:hypothetical protein
MGRSEDSSKVGALLGEVPRLSGGGVQRLRDVSEGDRGWGGSGLKERRVGGNMVRWSCSIITIVG